MRYPVVTLCGSTRFKDEFIEVQRQLTLEGNIVISVALFGHSGDSEVWENLDEGTLTKTRKMLDVYAMSIFMKLKNPVFLFTIKIRMRDVLSEISYEIYKSNF